MLNSAGSDGIVVNGSIGVTSGTELSSAAAR